MRDKSQQQQNGNIIEIDARVAAKNIKRQIKLVRKGQHKRRHVNEKNAFPAPIKYYGNTLLQRD